MLRTLYNVYDAVFTTRVIKVEDEALLSFPSIPTLSELAGKSMAG